MAKTVNWGVHAWLCRGCGHLTSNHVGTPDAGYRCAHCACTGNAGSTGLSKAQFDEYMARPETPPNIWAAS